VIFKYNNVMNSFYCFYQTICLELKKLKAYFQLILNWTSSLANKTTSFSLK